MPTTNYDDFNGRVLVVDLTRDEVKTEKVSGEALYQNLGGACLGAKLLYDRVLPGVNWNDPGNCLIIASGPLGGTVVPGSGTISVITKGALTEGAAVTQANGYFGAYLRHCGFDAVLVTGAAAKLSYIHIYSGGAEIHDASFLAGKDTWETGDLIRQELKGARDVSVACIGPAGENLVRFAGVFCDRGHAAAHNGSGAVMGAKKLKAIVVEAGRIGIPVKDSRRLLDIAGKLSQRLQQAPRPGEVDVYRWGTLNNLYQAAQMPVGHLPVRNYTTNAYDIRRVELERFNAASIRSRYQAVRSPCFGCPLHHSHIFTVPEGPCKGKNVDEPEYEGLAAWGPVTGQTDVTWAIVLADLADRLGLDTNEGGWVVGLAMECYEKGLITKQDCDGLELTWGNGEATYTLLQRIARCQGIGSILAEGAMRAARQLGGEGPLSMAVHTMKGNTPRGHDHRAAWSELFDTCVSNTGTLESGRLPGQRQVQFLEMLVSNTGTGGSGQVAKETVARYKSLPRNDPFSPEGVPLLNALTKGPMLFEDSLGVCRFITWTDLQLLTELLEAATGWRLSVVEALDVGRRAVNRLRVFNLKQGISPETDRPSPRYGSAPVDGPARGKSVLPVWPQMLATYYQAMGWDAQGRPLPETLENLGLSELIPDLETAVSKRK